MKNETYIPISSAEDLKKAALRSARPIYRFLNLNYSKKKLIQKYPQASEWLAKQDTASKIWPFEFNRNTLAMRKGFLAVQNGRVEDYIITEQS